MPYIQDEAADSISRQIGDQGKAHVTTYVWDTGSLSWVKATQAVAGGSSDATAANQATEITALQAIQTQLSKQEAVRIDKASATITYFGFAAIATANAGATWKIFKIDTGEKLWADGNSNYDNVWNNRAALAYS